MYLVTRQLHKSLRAESQASSSNLVPSLKQVPSLSVLRPSQVKSSHKVMSTLSSQVESSHKVMSSQVESSHKFVKSCRVTGYLDLGRWGKGKFH